VFSLGRITAAARQHRATPIIGYGLFPTSAGCAAADHCRQVEFLDYIDGDLDQADPAEAIGQIVSHIRRIQPQVIVTFGPDRSYGHPDHIAISQFTSAAVVCAAAAYSMTQAVRAELGAKRIRVHAVFPGAVDTDMLRSVEMPKTSPPEIARAVLAKDRSVCTD
jgi:LmbE family N-acetylglucosaminyl deacetylase